MSRRGVSRRVVVTGVGLVSSLGVGTEKTWAGIKAGQSGISRIELFDPSRHDCQIAGEIKGFEPGDYVEKKEIKKMARFMHFAVAASDFALDMAKLDRKSVV